MSASQDIIQAGDTIERLAMQYEGMVAAGKLLKSIGSLENHVIELNKKRDTLLAEVGEYQAKIEDKKDALDRLAEAVVSAELKADQDADRLLRQSTLEANAIIVRANAAAEVVKRSVDNTIQEKANAAIAEADAAKRRLEFINYEISEKQSILTDLEAQAIEAQANRQKFLDYLDTIRSTPVA